MYQYLKRPKVSICIPAYENPEGITRLLDSILTQLFTDYEIIITDDSKTDRVEAAVRAAEDGFVAYGFSGIDTGSRIRYYRNRERKGAVANWNEAVSRAQGEYVKIMHHDDWFTDERCLALFVEMLDQHPEADMAFSGSYQVEPGMSAEELAKVRKGRRFGLFVKPRTESEKRHAVKSKFARGIAEKDEALLREDFRNLYLGNTIGAPSAVIVRKSALDKWKITYDTNLTWLVDEEYYLQILQNNPHYAFTVKPLISIGLSYSQLTEKVESDELLQRKEYTYVYRKYDLQKADARFARFLSDVLAKNHTQEKEACGIPGITHAMYRESVRKTRKALRERRLATLDYLTDKAQGKLEKRFGKAANVLFYIGLLLEIALVIIDKSDLSNPYTGRLFQLTFILFLFRMLCAKWNRKERAAIFAALVLGAIVYKASGRNDLIRYTVFMAAGLAAGPEKVCKTTFFASIAGCLSLVFLSVTGIFGTLKLTQDFGHGVETRWCLGLGHPNALHCMAMMLVLFALYLYYDQIKPWMLAALAAGNLGLYFLTKSNTAFAVTMAAVLLTALMKKGSRLQKSSVVYVLGEAAVTAGLVFSLLAAVMNPADYPSLKILDHLLTGRMASLWDTTFYEGTLGTWHLFSGRDCGAYFDLGFVRIIYWYGTVAGAAVIALLFVLLRRARLERNAALFILLTACCIYTVPEAHLVSRYIARNYCLMPAAMTLASMLGRKEIL